MDLGQQCHFLPWIYVGTENNSHSGFNKFFIKIIELIEKLSSVQKSTVWNVYLPIIINYYLMILVKYDLLRSEYFK